MTISVLIFAVTYFIFAAGRLPGFRIDRTGAAIIGASLIIATGALSMEEAYEAVNYDTIVLLFGTMIVVANLRLAGFFRLVSYWAVRRAHQPKTLLAAIILATGVLSAFFVNDTICLVMTPLVLDVTLALHRNPVPYLLAVATSSNIGSTATITGNPQNMIIGTFSGISFASFSAVLAPVALIGLGLAFLTIVVLYRDEFQRTVEISVPKERVLLCKPLLWKSLAAAVFMIVFFFVGWQVSKVALTAGAFVLVTRRVKPQRIYAEIDFSLLVMFVGLFIVVAGFARSPFAVDMYTYAGRLALDRVPVLSAAALVLSNLVSNVPAVLAFHPFLAKVAQPDRAWLTLAMASTLAGNLTLVGSIANLIVVQQAKKHVRITFWEYFRVGAPLTLLTLTLGVFWLTFSFA